MMTTETSTPDTIVINKPVEVNVQTNTPGSSNVSSPQTRMAEATSNLSNEDLKEVALERLKWENRRRIAWVFTYAAIAYGFLLLAALIIGPKDVADRITAATDLNTWVFMGFLTIPGLYFGGTVVEKFSGTFKKN